MRAGGEHPVGVNHRPTTDPESKGARRLRRLLLSRPLLGSFFLARLPLAAVAGLRVTRLDPEVCEVTVPFGWRTTNPFGSIYFAALTMAAELSAAGLALMATEGAPERVSVLPVGLEAEFQKKATTLTRFTCVEGKKLFDAVDETLTTGEGVKVTVETTGSMQDGTPVARFKLTWSFKRKRAATP